jgi:hypothetical protein
MKVGHYFVIVMLLTTATIVSGCFCCDISSGSGSGELNNFSLENGTHIAPFSPDLRAGADAEFHVVSDHPLNMIIMDQDNFTKYYAAEQGAPANWSAYAIALNVTNGGLRFLAPQDGRYLFVLDNTRLVEGSGAGLATANIRANYSYNWSYYPFNLRYYSR